MADTKTTDSYLADFMCFSIYSANLAYSRVYRPVLERLGLTYPQYIAVVSLWEEDGQTVKGLSDNLFLEPSTVTPMLKKLEAMELLTRSRDTEDERIVRVSLTEKGRLLREEAKKYSPATMRASGLNKEDFRALQKAVAALRDHLVQASQKGLDLD